MCLHFGCGQSAGGIQLSTNPYRSRDNPPPHGRYLALRPAMRFPRMGWPSRRVALFFGHPRFELYLSGPREMVARGKKTERR